ncbi:MAG: hypothetical protein RLZZ253_2908 [Verrucomicrobiota bacterium]
MEVTDEKLPPLAPPEPARVQIILPGPSQTISETATQLAALMACRDYFRRGSEIVRVIDGPRGPTLESLGVQLFRSEAESLGELGCGF